MLYQTIGCVTRCILRVPALLISLSFNSNVEGEYEGRDGRDVMHVVMSFSSATGPEKE